MPHKSQVKMIFDPYFLIALLMAITIHEFCHAWVANFLGDPTARYLGRLSLNPLAHLDPVGTIMLLLVGFGWGKPVPFQTRYLRSPRFDSAMIAFSGPFSNFILALLFTLPLRYTSFQSEVLRTFFETAIQLNLLLMMFNLLPLPPLDGSKIFSLLIPGDFLKTFEQYRNVGYGLLLLIVFSGSIFGIDILGTYFLYPGVRFFSDILGLS